MALVGGWAAYLIHDLLDADGNVLASLLFARKRSPANVNTDEIWLITTLGSTSTPHAPNSWDITIAADSITASGSGWSLTVPFSGTATQVQSRAFVYDASGLDTPTATVSTDDISAYLTVGTHSATASDTATLSPTGDYAGAWLTNAAQPELAILAEAEPADSDDPYFILSSTRESGELAANTVALAIEGSADVVTVALGPRLHETWSLNIACTTQAAYKALVALLADSAAVSLRFPDSPRWIGLGGGFYAVGTVSSQRVGHPQLGPVMVVSLPLTPSRAPAYKPLWQWNARTLAQTGMSSRDVNNAYATARDLLVGPV